MARTDWTAIVTGPAQEYLAYSELTRFGLSPYLPQIKRRWITPRTGKLMVRQYALFPCYLFLPVVDIKTQVFDACAGLRRPHSTLTHGDGRLWRAPATVIEGLRAAEAAGYFDDVLVKGDKIRINSGVLAGIPAFLESSTTNSVELLTPLLGGAKVKLAANRVSRA